jgi:hypothetical protein
MAFVTWIIIAVAILAIAAGIFVVIMARKKPEKFDGKYPEGHFMGQGIAIGIGIGVALGLALGNIALGPAIGVAIGVGIGSALEGKAKKEGKIRPMTPEEKKKQKKVLLFALGVGLLLFILGVIVFFLVRK